MLRLLLQQGGDPHRRVVLYDGEDAWSLASRFQRGEEVLKVLDRSSQVEFRAMFWKALGLEAEARDV